MTLKPDRFEDVVITDYFMNDTSVRGVIVIHSTSGSGASLDDANAVVAIPSGGASGTDPAGLLLNDVVDLDLTRQHLNEHQDEVQVGGKVALLRRGWVVTDRQTGSPTAGQAAYYNSNGYVTPTNPMAGGSAVTSDEDYQRQRVGRFLSSPDADGYVKVEINLH